MAAAPAPIGTRRHLSVSPTSRFKGAAQNVMRGLPWPRFPAMEKAQCPGGGAHLNASREPFTHGVKAYVLFRGGGLALCRTSYNPVNDGTEVDGRMQTNTVRQRR